MLSDPSVVNITSSIGINMAEISSLRQFIVNMKKIFSRSRETMNKNIRTSKAKKALVNAICIGMVTTPPKDMPENRNESASGQSLSWRSFSRLFDFSVGSGRHIMSLSSKKRREIAEGNQEGWIIVEDDDKRTKYSSELLDALKIWMEDNEMVCHNPCKGEDIIKRDREGKIVRDPITNQPVRVAKMLLKCNPRLLHQHMIETFDEATDGINVLISESKLRLLLKTSCNIKQMTEHQKMMCGCETCIIVEDMQQSVNLFRNKLISSMTRDINGMRNGGSKNLAESQLAEYISHICADGSGSELKHNTAWEAASLSGCGSVEISGRQYIPFPCALQQCNVCVNRWDKLVLKLEANCTERISYVLYGSHQKCSYHGDEHIISEGSEHRCGLCDRMNDIDKSKLKGGSPRVKKVRLRIMLTESMNEFMKNGGTYENYMWKMYNHIAHVKILGSKFGSRMCYDHWKETDGVIVIELDYSERYQPIPMREIQSENFAKDSDVSMEIHIVSYQAKLDGPDSLPTRLVASYTALSDEKPQIAATTF